ncbi:MAG: hypothetical protein PHS42_08745 [Sulfurimonas sp.]|nr:hypothetical protein [Sulfurimonas sp.]MDD3835547.1 hypothetical protein [Sulfurimonas sp.]
MALINCPECKKEVSDQAKECNGCGYPLSGIAVVKDKITTEPESSSEVNSDSVENLKMNNQAIKSKKKFTTKEIITMPFFFFVLSLLVVGLFVPNSAELFAAILFLIINSIQLEILFEEVSKKLKLYIFIMYLIPLALSIKFISSSFN